MFNGPAMPPIPAGVQTPVVGPCGVSEVPLALAAKGQAEKRQVTDAGMSPVVEERMYPEAKREEVR